MAAKFLQSLIGELTFKITEDNLLIRTGQLRARLRLYPTMVFSQILLEPLFVSLYWDQADHLELLWWLTSLYVIHAVEMFLWWRYREQVNTVYQCKAWRLKFNLLTVAVALLWGGIALWFFPQDLAYQALMICLILGLVAGAVTLDPVYPPSLYIYVSGVASPLLARLIIVSDETHLILAGMLLLFIISSLSAGRELSKTFWKSLYQRNENDFLITQLTRQMTIADTANREKSRFLAAASHDLRQPLQALVLFSDAINVVAKDKDTLHLAGQIGKSVAALVDMFDELLDISKFDAGVVQVLKQHFKVQDIFDRLQAEFMPQAFAKDLKFGVLSTGLIAYSDPHLLERILRNLISNAIRYTNTGKVQVACLCINDMLQFEVLDTGIGIDATNLNQIFEEYYQVNNQHRDRLKGLGLGLAIVRRMEVLLGCKVDVVSTHGLGSVFSFSIPQGNADKIEYAGVPQHPKHDLSGITVALVDDNTDIRKTAARLMEQWGCQVIEGERHEDVLGNLKTAGTPPDIFICDYRLKHSVTAIDAIKLLRGLWDHDIPTLVLTGDTAAQPLQDIKAIGALLLHKPITPARLRSIIYFALHNDNRANNDINERL